MSSPPPGPWSDLARPPLRPGALRAALVGPGRPLARLEVLAEVGSTSAELLARAGADPAAWPAPSALTADAQTAGVGRLGRSWVSPPRSGVVLSLLLRPGDGPAPVPPERWSWLPLLAGLAVVGVVRDVAGLPAALKWPNDVLVEGRKLCGVLVQRSGGAVVVGVGLNTTLAAEELPVPTATSLRLERAATTDRDVLVRALVRALVVEVDRWAAAGGDARASGLAARVAEACSTLGRRVRVELPGGGELVGEAEGLDDDGRLLVRPDAVPGAADRVSGPVAVAAGDVVHVRDPAPPEPQPLP